MHKLKNLVSRAPDFLGSNFLNIYVYNKYNYGPIFSAQNILKRRARKKIYSRLLTAVDEITHP